MRYIYFTCMVVIAINYVASTAESNFLENDIMPEAVDGIRSFFKRLDKKLRDMDNDDWMQYLNDDHYMMRKSQRSPSLRLRFGRSSPNTDVQRILKYKTPVQYNQGY